MVTATDRVIEILRPRPRLGIAEWAEAHRLIVGSPLAGRSESPVRWSNSFFALQLAVMESLADRRWHSTALMTAPQRFGKTDCGAINPILYRVAQDRASALYVSASSDLGITQYRTKFEPAIYASPALRSLVPDNRDEAGTKNRHDFRNGASIHVHGAESVGNLSAFTAPVVICDDVQAYPATLPGFGHPADVATTRAGAFPQSQVTIAYIGTAGVAGDYLDRAIQRSAMFCPFVPCPSCGVYQILDWDRFVFDDTSIEAARRTVRHRCAACDHAIAYGDLGPMLRRAEWVSCPPGEDWIHDAPAGGVTLDADDLRPYPYTERSTVAAGFWCPAWYWPLLNWADLVADFIGRRGDPDRLRDWQQNVCVRPYDEPETDIEVLTADEITTHATTGDDGYADGTVPGWADVLTITADVQAGYCYAIARAWNSDDGTSALVKAFTTKKHSGIRAGERLSGEERRARHAVGVARALDELYQRVRDGFPRDTAGGELVPYAALLIDCGYMPDVVYRWALALGLRRHVPIRGYSGNRAAAPIWSGVWKQSAGRKHCDIGTNEAKHVLRQIMRIGPGEPGYWYLPRDMNSRTLTRYSRHLSSERWDTTKKPARWVRRDGGGPNHWLDCETYQIAAAIACGVPLPALDSAEPVVKRRAVAAPLPAAEAAAAGVPRDAYLANRRRGAGGWIRKR
jgi:phage terminase large subunit GpA-like protein